MALCSGTTGGTACMRAPYTGNTLRLPNAVPRSTVTPSVKGTPGSKLGSVSSPSGLAGAIGSGDRSGDVALATGAMLSGASPRPSASRPYAPTPKATTPTVSAPNQSSFRIVCFPFARTTPLDRRGIPTGSRCRPHAVRREKAGTLRHSRCTIPQRYVGGTCVARPCCEDITMKHTLLFFAAVGAAAVSTACTSTVICKGDNCDNPTSSGGSNSGGNNSGGSNSGGSNSGGTNPGGSNAGGGVPDLSDVCDAMCACEGCGPGELQQCYSDVDELASAALAAGCDKELAHVDQCFANGVECKNGSLYFGCENEIQLLTNCMNDTPPPPTDLCDYAAQICGASTGGGGAECVGQAYCVAQCIVGFDSCDLNDADLEACISNCM